MQNYCLVTVGLYIHVGLGSLGVTYSPLDPRFMGLNPTEVDGILSVRKNLEHYISTKQ